MFHFTRRRIESHVCICFVALKVYKELERLLKLSEIRMSVDKVLALAQTIVTIQINQQSENGNDKQQQDRQQQQQNNEEQMSEDNIEQILNLTRQAEQQTRKKMENAGQPRRKQLEKGW